MNAARIGELAALAAMAVLVGLGGKALLLALGRVKLAGALIAAGALIVALRALRQAYDPNDPAARINVTRAGAYVCAAALALLAIVAPAKFIIGACIVAAEAAIVFDFIATAAGGRTTRG
jgi:hypothetical protein